VTKVDTLPASMPIDTALSFFMSDDHRHKSYPVIDMDSRLVGMVTRADVLRWRTRKNRETETLYDAVSDRALTVGYPDEILGRLADTMVAGGLGRVPVVERGTKRILGLIARKDLLHIRSTVTAAENDRVAFFGRTKPPVPAVNKSR
jgi:CIC family chloride channel protein